MIAICNIRQMAAVTLISVAASSCIYDETPNCPDEKVEITILNDWDDAPAANPEGMAYLFYRVGVNSPWRFDFPGVEAGKVALEPGEYEFVIYNDDTSDIVFDADQNGLPFVTTNPDRIRVNGEEMELYESPDMMWSGFACRVMVSPEGVKYTSGDSIMGAPGNYVIVTDPRQITPTYTVKVLHVANLQGVAAMKGWISGMSLGMELYERIESETAVKVSFAPQKTSDSTVAAAFNTFGLPFHHKILNELNLLFLLSDGTTVGRKYDVTHTVMSASDPLNVEIVIDSISLPYAPAPIEGGTFDPTVVGWETIIVNYGT